MKLMDELLKPTINLFNLRHVVLVALTVLLTLITGASFLIIPSPYSPLIILAGIVGIILLFTWLHKPLWALYFTLFVVFLPTSLIPADVNSLLNRSATIIAFLVWVIDLIRRRRSVIITTSTLFMFLFILWASITLIWATDSSVGIQILQRYMLRLILFLILITNEITKRKDLDGLMNTLALSGGLMAMVGLGTIFLQGYTAGTRLEVLDVNENSLGLELLITTPAVLLWALRPMKNKNPIKKWLAAFFILASIGLTGLSGSRGSAISLGITLLAFLFWKPTRPWGILGLVIIGIAAIAAPILFSTTIGRFLLVPGETILGGREFLWPAGWQLISDHFLLGVGIGNSPTQVLTYLGYLRGFSLSSIEEPLHNPILVIWAETGLPGLILYLGILVSALFSFGRCYLQSMRIGAKHMIAYFALTTSVFIGYLASWIKGGGIESDFSYFLILALLLIPSSLELAEFQK